MENDTLDDALVSLIRIFVRRKLLFMVTMISSILISIGVYGYINLKDPNTNEKESSKISSFFLVGSYVAEETGIIYNIEDINSVLTFLNANYDEKIEENFIVNSNNSIIKMESKCDVIECDSINKKHITILKSLKKRHSDMSQVIRNSKKLHILEESHILSSMVNKYVTKEKNRNKNIFIFASMLFFSFVFPIILVLFWEYYHRIKSKLS